MADVANATSALSTKGSNQSHGSTFTGHRFSVDRTFDLSVRAFKKVLDDLILRETLLHPTKVEERAKDEEDDSSKPGDVKLHTAEDDNATRKVLTIYSTSGHGSQPKQVFSSLQDPVYPNVSGDDDLPTVKVYRPISEASLPNGISTATVLPYHPSDKSKTKTQKTLGEAFGGSSTLPQLKPAQPRQSATKSSSVDWYNPREIGTSRRVTGPESRRNYVNSYTPSGQWLSYSNPSSTARLSSPEAKRKQRDRALSIGEPKPNNANEGIESQQRAKESSLFKSAYSSFAPAFDNTNAIVPNETRAHLWWRKYGERRFDARLASNLTDEEPSPPNVPEEGKAEDDDFEDVVQQWKPEEKPTELNEHERDVSSDTNLEKETDDILQEISELLETLYSYQRNRYISTPTQHSRTSLGTSTHLTSMTGSPTTPSPGEFNIYEMLRTNLSLLIGSLPPYAVAKLDSDQLAELNISTKMVVETQDYPGTMEEDEQTAANKSAPKAVAGQASRVPPLPGSISSRTPSYPSASTTQTFAQRQSYLAQNRPQVTPSAGQPYYSNRPAPSYNSYSSSGTPSAATPYRPPQSTPQAAGYNAQRTYAAATAANTPAQPYPRPTSNGYGQSYPHTAPPAQVSNQAYAASRPGQPAYPARSQSNAYNAAAAASMAGRSSSPQNPTTTYNAHSYQHNQSYGTPTPSQSQPRYFQQPQSYQYNQAQGAQTSRPSSSTAHRSYDDGLGSQMLAAQQAITGEQRFKQPPQQATAARQGSGTPQPPVGGPNGTASTPYSGSPQRVATPGGGQQNGTAVGGR